MPGVPSDISEVEIQLACGGPLAWPADPRTRILFACWVLDRLEAALGKERTTNCLMMGSFGAADTDAKMQAGLARLARINSDALATGKPPGPAAVKVALF
ncbi:hypothetical protein [Primorskyibacter sp. S87]|uniref:hypothetical protein n=1 Tax=Primorskyibacter sp. S87 TaxID=3415126 RepID=UPI003C79E6D8